MKYAFWLAKVNGISSKEKLRLLELLGTEEAIFQMTEYRLNQMHMIPERTKKALLAAKNEKEWEREYRRFLDTGIRLVPYGSPEYPEKLTRIYDPPYCLYVKGRLPPKNQICVAIVGARKCSSYGQAVAELIGRKLALSGVGVISGMAYGIDTAAHEGAVSSQEKQCGRNKTIADATAYGVLGCGVDICYPSRNRQLYHRVESCGGLISEFPMGRSPEKWFFPMRNRIISGLSDAVVVVEARKRSGSLITADLALEQGKPVYAVPGRIGDELSFGTNWLLSQGAEILYSLKEFLWEIGIQKPEDGGPEKIVEIPLEKNEWLVYSDFGSTPKHLEAVIEETGLTFAETAAALTGLKKKGRIQEVYKNYFIKVMIE